MQTDYQEFIKSKIRSHSASGFECGVLSDKLFPFQELIVRSALRVGKYAIFADCGLGKTFMQLEWARQVVNKTRQSVLILCPLAVSGQTIAEGKKFGIKVSKQSDKSKSPCIEISNYEQLENIDTSKYSGIVLDESSILKNYEGAYKKLIIDLFRDTPYKLACTATPAPNDPMELGNHSEFLNIMSRSEMLSMYFVHDGGETAKWRIKGHAVNKFYKWVSTWAVMITKPSDLGFDDDGYNLPPLNYIEKQIKTETRGGQLFNGISISATKFNQELRITKLERIEQAAQIVNASDENFIVWIKHNSEGEELKKLIPEMVEVSGGDKSEYKEEKLLGFARNEFRVLVTKAKMGQYGLNYQNCHNQVFASLDFSFESLYQAIRRSYRFGQKYPVNIYIITTDTMQNVIESIKEKQRQFDDMHSEMTKHTTICK